MRKKRKIIKLSFLKAILGYLAAMSPSIEEGFFGSGFCVSKYSPRTKSISPWPASPNIIPKRNGKVMIQKYPGLIS